MMRIETDVRFKVRSGFFRAMTTQPNGRIVVAGGASGLSGSQFMLARVTTIG
jgi:hypothetical protein